MGNQLGFYSVGFALDGFSKAFTAAEKFEGKQKDFVESQSSINKSFDGFSDKLRGFKETEKLGFAMRVFNSEFQRGMENNMGVVGSLGLAFGSAKKSLVGFTGTATKSLLGTLTPLALIGAALFVLQKIWENNIGGIQTKWARLMGRLQVLYAQFEFFVIRGLKELEPIFDFLFNQLFGIIDKGVSAIESIGKAFGMLPTPVQKSVKAVLLLGIAIKILAFTPLLLVITAVVAGLIALNVITDKVAQKYPRLAKILKITTIVVAGLKLGVFGLIKGLLILGIKVVLVVGALFLLYKGAKLVWGILEKVGIIDALSKALTQFGALIVWTGKNVLNYLLNPLATIVGVIQEVLTQMQKIPGATKAMKAAGIDVNELQQSLEGIKESVSTGVNLGDITADFAGQGISKAAEVKDFLLASPEEIAADNRIKNKGIAAPDEMDFSNFKFDANNMPDFSLPAKGGNTLSNTVNDNRTINIHTPAITEGTIQNLDEIMKSQLMKDIGGGA